MHISDFCPNLQHAYLYHYQPNQDFQHPKFIRKMISTIPFKYNFMFQAQIVQNSQNNPKHHIRTSQIFISTYNMHIFVIINPNQDFKDPKFIRKMRSTNFIQTDF